MAEQEGTKPQSEKPPRKRKPKPPAPRPSFDLPSLPTIVATAMGILVVPVMSNLPRWVYIALISICLLPYARAYLLGLVKKQRLSQRAFRVYLCVYIALSLVAVFGIPYLTTIERQIALYERYAEQWGGRNGDRVHLTEHSGLRNVFSPTTRYRLTPAVQIRKHGATLSNVKVLLYIPKPFHGIDTNYWVKNFVGNGFTVFIARIYGEIPSGDPVSVDAPLFVESTEHFKGYIGYIIKGKVQDGAKTNSFGPIKGFFPIELHE